MSTLSKSIYPYLEACFDPLPALPVGLAACVCWQGEVIYEKYTGYANLEHQQPVSGSTVFPLSSMTKQFTAMLIMLLAEEGRLDYSQPLRAFFPDLPAWADPITIAHLLYQTSGLVDAYNYYFEHGLGLYGITNSAVYDLLRQQSGLLFAPGERFEYCNSNYILLAQLAERLCGASFHDLLRSRLFQPLGMNQSLLYDLPYVIPQRAYGYREEAGAVFATDYLFQTYGDGGIFSSMQDMIAWDHALGSNQLVSQAVIERAWQTGLTNAGQTTGYGLGWKVGRLGRYATVWHGGGDPGFASLIQRIPQLELSLILFTNADGRSDWLKDVAQKMIVELLECLSEK